jgi:phospholipase A1/A2
MKRKIYIYIAIILIVWVVAFILAKKIFAIEAISQYKSTYIIAGDKTNQVKYQVSLKYALVYPYESGVYFAYTQLSKWNVYDRSSPFKESNYQPSIFWEKNNVWYFDTVRIAPYQHCSNGEDGSKSRSIETGFAQARMSYGKRLNIGIDETLTWFYAVSNKNSDYRRYKGNFRTELFLQLKGNGKYLDQEKIYTAFEWTHKYGWVECGLIVRLLTAYARPKLYVQYFYGTAEFLENYKDKTNALRAGIIFDL